ncbi:MAG: erythromycin esterase family protein [Actinobacteria bacterium]|nr:erythromycin esterase family protein [Actinomycetota bacterium]
MADLRRAARPVDDLLELVGEARFVLLGEATHGTHEFYALRAELTRRLVGERGFRGVAVEADWPAAARVNRYVQRAGDDHSATEALSEFVRFPQWMWRNHIIVELVQWLRNHDGDAGFYGLDLYSLRESMSAVVKYLDTIDADAAARARARYGCFDHFDEQAYGYATATGQKESCEDDVVAQLRELHQRAAELAVRDGRLPRDAHFAAEQNARLAVDAERYYRAMFRGRASSWNLRDTHMADTLDALHEHLGGAGIVVWAHNSHLGDARATEMGQVRGEINLGQLARERHGDDVCIVGFTTHTGTVTAARDWDAPAERRVVRPSQADSLERMLHDAGIDRAVLELRDGLLAGELLQRMIGVIYRPETERWSHYVYAHAAQQFDLLVHVDETTALEPLEPWSAHEQPAETYPTGL